MNRQLQDFPENLHVKRYEAAASSEPCLYISISKWKLVGQSEYYRNLGFSIYGVAKRGYFDTAVVKTVLEFKAPARVDSLLDVFVRVSRIGNTSLTSEMELYPQQSDQLLTTIQVISVGYSAESGTSRPVPNEIRELINHFEDTGIVLPMERFPKLAEAVKEI